MFCLAGRRAAGAFTIAIPRASLIKLKRPLSRSFEFERARGFFLSAWRRIGDLQTRCRDTNTPGYPGQPPPTPGGGPDPLENTRCPVLAAGGGRFGGPSAVGGGAKVGRRLARF